MSIPSLWLHTAQACVDICVGTSGQALVCDNRSGICDAVLQRACATSGLLCDRGNPRSLEQRKPTPTTKHGAAVPLALARQAITPPPHRAGSDGEMLTGPGIERQLVAHRDRRRPETEKKIWTKKLQLWKTIINVASEQTSNKNESKSAEVFQTRWVPGVFRRGRRPGALPGNSSATRAGVC